MGALKLVKPTALDAKLTLGYCVIISCLIFVVNLTGLLYDFIWYDAAFQNVVNKILISIVSYPIFYIYLKRLLLQSSPKNKERYEWKKITVCYFVFFFPQHIVAALDSYFQGAFPVSSNIRLIFIILDIVFIYIGVIGNLIIIMQMKDINNMNIFKQFMLANSLLKKNIMQVVIIELVYALISGIVAMISTMFLSLNGYDIILNDVLPYPFMYGMGILVLPVYYKLYGEFVEIKKS